MRCLAVAVTLLLCALASGEAVAQDVAVIVNKANATQDVSLGELVRLFKQERKFWDGGQRVYLLTQETGSAEQKIVLEKIYRMDARALKKFWLGKLYRGEIPTYPKTLGSNEAVAQFVSQVPNAIGFVDSSYVNDRVQVLRIDGRLPGQLGYALENRFATRRTTGKPTLMADSSSTSRVAGPADSLD